MNKIDKDLVYLDTYVLQQDMRIRLPKQILENMSAIKGKTTFSIYYDKNNNQLILRLNKGDNANGR